LPPCLIYFIYKYSCVKLLQIDTHTAPMNFYHFYYTPVSQTLCPMSYKYLCYTAGIISAKNDKQWLKYFRAYIANGVVINRDCSSSISRVSNSRTSCKRSCLVQMFLTESVTPRHAEVQELVTYCMV